MNRVDVAACHRIKEDRANIVKYGGVQEREFLELPFEDAGILLKSVVGGGIGRPIHQGSTEVAGPHVDGLEKCILSDGMGWQVVVVGQEALFLKIF